MESNWVFIVTLVILVIFAIKGWRQGLLGMIFALLSWVFVIGFIYVAAPQVESALTAKPEVYSLIYDKVERHISDEAAKETGDNLGEWYSGLTQVLPSGDTAELSQDLQQFNNLQKNIDLSGLMDDSGISSENIGGAAGLLALGNGQQTILQTISLKITGFIIHCIAVILTFLIAEIVIMIVGLLVKAIGRMPLIRPTNLLLGTVAGVAEGMMVVWLLFYMVACISQTALGQEVISRIYENPFLITMYENNLIMTFVK